MTDPKAEAAVRFLCVCGSSWISPAHGRCEACGRQRPQYSFGEHAGFLAGRASRDADIQSAVAAERERPSNNAERQGDSMARQLTHKTFIVGNFDPRAAQWGLSNFGAPMYAENLQVGNFNPTTPIITGDWDYNTPMAEWQFYTVPQDVIVPEFVGPPIPGIIKLKTDKMGDGKLVLVAYGIYQGIVKPHQP